MKSITQFAVKYPVTVAMIVMGTLLLGYISFGKLGMDLFPNLKSPKIYVEVKSGERPPEEMEEVIVNKVEAVAIRQSDVVNVTSVSTVGSAQIVVEYAWRKDMNEAFLDLQKSLASFGQSSDVDELTISQHDPNATPIVTIALTNNDIKDLNALRRTAEGYIRNELIRLEGIAEVEVAGADRQEVLVETDPKLLEAYGLSPNDVASKIKSFNQNVSGGSVVEKGRRYVVKGLSQITALEDLRNVILKVQRPTAAQLKAGAIQSVVRISDVAKVTLNTTERDNSVFLNGEPCIGLSVYKETRYNTVQAVKNLQDDLKKIEKALPGYKFTIVQNQGNFISSAIGEVESSAGYGMILAVFVLILFLRSFKTTLVVSIAMPISIIATFTLMYFNHLTLNVMTLGGLALGAGMLVDNAIVVIENIFRLRTNGMSVREAAVEGTSQVGGAVFSSTLTTIVVFLPIVYLNGASGELFREQALTVTYSLLCSLIVAILVIPVLYDRFIGSKKKVIMAEPIKTGVSFNFYRKILGNILNHKTAIIGSSLVLLVAGYFMARTLGSEFMPVSADRSFLVDVKMPEGTGLDRTVGASQGVVNFISALAPDEIEFSYNVAGPAAGEIGGEQSVFLDQNTALIKVMLKAGSNKSTSTLMKAITAHYNGLQDIEIRCRQEESSLQSVLGTEEAPMVVEISGEDADVLESLTKEAVEKLSDVPGLIALETSIEGGAPEVEINIDRYRAGILGLDVSAVVGAIKEALSGTDAGQVDLNGDIDQIVIKNRAISLNDIALINIKSGSGYVSIGEVAKIKIGSAAKQVLHNNQNRVIKVMAGIAPGYILDKVAENVNEVMATIDFPAEYKYNLTGQEEKRREATGSLTFALLLSLILVYMVMASQFEHLVHPFVVLLTVPLSIIGGLIPFWLTGSPLNMMAYIGLIMLGGIAVNNSIILVDAINQFRREGVELKEAIINAGGNRIRPILMTTLTTILGMLPMTFGFGESASLRAPMAWAVIGGLMVATIISLVVIPCVYYVFNRRYKHKTLDV